MAVRGGRLEFLVPHFLRGQLLRPGFVRMSLRLGAAQQMPGWAKLQFLNAGVSAEDLDRVLGRVTSLTSWVDEWESLGRSHEQGGRDALALGRESVAAERFLAASAAYNFSQYVVFLDTDRKQRLHEACVRAYSSAAPLFEVPARPFEVRYRRRVLEGYLRVPPGRGPAPVVVIFNGTNAVKEELHWWSESFVQRGIATVLFDGPGLGRTFHKLSWVAEPRPIGTAVMNAIETHPELDPGAVVFLGMSLGGYMAIRMASHDGRIRAVAAVSPPYSADIYWKVTLAGMRRELAALYQLEEREMSSVIEKITLADVLPGLSCPLMISGGGHDHITPGSEAWRIFEGARCERELVFYPRGAHDCFNVLSDLRPRMVTWLARQLEKHHPARRAGAIVSEPSWDGFAAAEAVDPDFAAALRGESTRVQWSSMAMTGEPARWNWLWRPPRTPGDIEVVHRVGSGAALPV
ncbi:MAG TPA: alpha/beta fold hydrolase [Candidatus Udaeobacter sp.]|jgi:2,6-dihydroxypseudooxynicotine hydrolase|nr:alpha/beta fold hydrolase [Candidatus Udaeobacter sp.]